MATTNTWEEVVEKITGVANRGAFSKTFTPTTSSQSASGGAGYYSSVTTKCNAVSLSGNAGVGDVLTGKTFYTSTLTKQTGTMANRGNLNWTPTGSTTYSVPAGYYSGGTLNSGTAYTNGYNTGLGLGKLGSLEYFNSGTVMYGVSYSAGTAYNCTKTSTGASYTFTNANGNFLLAVYGYQALWANEFAGVSVTKTAGSGNLLHRFSTTLGFPQSAGWTGSECGSLYFHLYQVSGAVNMNVTVTHAQSGSFRLNGAVTFLS